MTTPRIVTIMSNLTFGVFLGLFLQSAVAHFVSLNTIVAVIIVMAAIVLVFHSRRTV